MLGKMISMSAFPPCRQRCCMASNLGWCPLSFLRVLWFPPPSFDNFHPINKLIIHVISHLSKLITSMSARHFFSRECPQPMSKFSKQESEPFHRNPPFFPPPPHPNSLSLKISSDPPPPPHLPYPSLAPSSPRFQHF